MPRPEAHSISDTTQHYSRADLGDAIRNLVMERGSSQIAYSQCRTDSSAQYLPSVDIANTPEAIIKQKKEAALTSQSAEQATPQNLEGGIRGLIDRTDSNNDDKLTRDEILTRLKTKGVTQGDAAALKTLLKNYDEIDANDNGLVNRDEINRRERTVRADRETLDRLAALRRLVVTRGQDLDRNSDGRISEGELGDASRTESLFTRDERRTLNWAHDTWAQTD